VRYTAKKGFIFLDEQIRAKSPFTFFCRYIEAFADIWLFLPFCPSDFRRFFALFPIDFNRFLC